MTDFVGFIVALVFVGLVVAGCRPAHVETDEQKLERRKREAIARVNRAYHNEDEAHWWV